MIHANMEDSIRQQLVPGARVTVLQQFAHRDPAKAWTNRVTGTVLEYMQKPTGSWFAHSKNDKLWLDRLKIRRDDGELMTLNLDEYSHIEKVEPAKPNDER
jgi:hypothetical protein